MEPFDKHNDKIAIALKRFKLLKKPGFFGRYFEPYIVSFAADSSGSGSENPQLEYSAIPFTKFRVGQEKRFLGHGRFIYQPNNPGEYVAYSILFMESEQETREVANLVKEAIQTREAKTILKGIMIAQPHIAGALAVVQKATSLAAAILEEKSDNQLFVSEGGFLRDVNGPPYDILTSTNDGNDFIECETSVIPLKQDQHESTFEGIGVVPEYSYTEKVSLL